MGSSEHIYRLALDGMRRASCLSFPDLLAWALWMQKLAGAALDDDSGQVHAMILEIGETGRKRRAGQPCRVLGSAKTDT